MKSATAIGQATLARLLAQAAANRASGERLYSVIRAAWIQHPQFTAKQLIRVLPPPFQKVSIRRCQDHMKRARAESSAPPQHADRP